MPFALPWRRASIAGGGSFAVSGSDGGQARPPRVSQPPQDAPPPGSVPLSNGDGRAVTNAAGPFVLASGTIPEGRRGVIRTLSLVVNGPTINTHIQGTLLVNGAPVEGLIGVDLYGRQGAASLERELSPLRVELPDGASWELDGYNVDGGAYTVEGIVTGWHYARELAE